MENTNKKNTKIKETKVKTLPTAFNIVIRKRIKKYINIMERTVSPNELLNETTSTNFKSSFLKNHYG